MSHINAPMYLVCSCKSPMAQDHWETFELFSEAKAELDRLLSLDDTSTAQLTVVLDGDGSYDLPPRPVKFTGRFWQILKHQMTT